MTLIEKFLKKCDEINLDFSINFRPNFDTNGRFYLSFGTFHAVHVLFDNEMVSFSFVNGVTPEDAMLNTIKELNGKYIEFKVLTDEIHEKKIRLVLDI